MRAFNKKRKLKHTTKPKYVKIKRYDFYITFSRLTKRCSVKFNVVDGYVFTVDRYDTRITNFVLNRENKFNSTKGLKVKLW